MEEGWQGEVEGSSVNLSVDPFKSAAGLGHLRLRHVGENPQPLASLEAEYYRKEQGVMF